jgi:integrase/recombinase XerD
VRDLVVDTWPCGVVDEGQRIVWVQRLRVAGSDQVSYTVIDSSGLPVEPADLYLEHLTAIGRSPYTVKAYAGDLRDFFEWVVQREADFRGLSLEDLAEFFIWLRRPPQARKPNVYVLPGLPSSLENTTLVRKRAAVAGLYRFHSRRDANVPALLGEVTGPRPTGGYVPMLVHTRRRGPGPDAYSPIRIATASKPPATLTGAEVRRLIEACASRRDRFLLILLAETGLRIGEALGMRHEDLRLRVGEVRVVPREDNANGARVKGLKARAVPAGVAVIDAYADYMETEYGALDSDYVFVNLFRPPLGAPMTHGAVEDLAARLRRHTGIEHFTPHVMRHTWATKLLRAKVPAEVVAKLLGHTSSQTTEQTYSHLTVEDHREVLVSAGLMSDGGEQE